MSANAREGERHGASHERPGGGQMLRGGRSGPSDWNVGAGAATWGKTIAPATVGEASVGSALMSGVAEQEDRQWRPLSNPPSSWSCCASPCGAAPGMPWSCSEATISPCEAGCCSHSCTAADTPRRGSSITSSTRTKVRSDFTRLRLARPGPSLGVSGHRLPHGRRRRRVGPAGAVEVRCRRDDWSGMDTSLAPPTMGRSIPAARRSRSRTRRWSRSPPRQAAAAGAAAEMNLRLACALTGVNPALPASVHAEPCICRRFP